MTHDYQDTPWYILDGKLFGDTDKEFFPGRLAFSMKSEGNTIDISLEKKDPTEEEVRIILSANKYIGTKLQFLIEMNNLHFENEVDEETRKSNFNTLMGW